MHEPTPTRVVTVVANGRDTKRHKADNGLNDAQVQMSPDLPPIESEAFAAYLKQWHKAHNPEE